MTKKFIKYISMGFQQELSSNNGHEVDPEILTADFFMAPNESWKLVDGLDFINLGVSAAWLHLSPDAQWDPNYQGFWVRQGSKAETWLALRGVGLGYGNWYGAKRPPILTDEEQGDE